MNSRTFRLFVSSTFSDFLPEREYLNDKIYPAIKALCAQKGYDFELVDLRWGVSNESALNQNTLDICLTEVHRCQQLSPRPNFLVMIGERYGWVPLPTRLDTVEFGQLLSECSASDKNLLEKWYRLDENIPGGMYILLPRTGKYTNDSKWGAEEEQLRSILQAAAHKASDKYNWTAEKLALFETSATEREIMDGLFAQDENCTNTLVLFRTSRAEAGQAEHDNKRLEALKERIRARMEGDGCAANIFELAYSPETADTYIKLFEDGMITMLKENIEREIERLNGFKRDEILLPPKAEAFYDRPDTTKLFTDYINKGDGSPLFIWGESGSGKSSLLAEVLRELEVPVFAVFFWAK